MDAREYAEEIREGVCVRCIDGDGAGNCRLDPSMQCALQRYLPLIVTAVSRVTSESMDAYVAELRGIVCAQCSSQSASGRCGLRAQVDCALDRYFPLVVEAIEKVNGRVRPETIGAGGGRR